MRNSHLHHLFFNGGLILYVFLSYQPKLLLVHLQGLLLCGLAYDEASVAGQQRRHHCCLFEVPGATTMGKVAC